jgi:hypothetical protein
MCSPIRGPALFGLLGADGALFAVAHGLEPIGGDALAHEEVDRGFCTPFTEDQVVLIRAALVAVPFDQDEIVRVSP